MSDTIKKRRRWPWGLVAAILLVTAAPIAWRFRPLNGTERRLICRWQENDGPALYHFTADRRFSVVSGELGTTGPWSATEDALRIGNDVSLGDLSGIPWGLRLRFYFEAKFTSDRVSLRFDGPDQFRFDETDFIRVPDGTQGLPPR